MRPQEYFTRIFHESISQLWRKLNQIHVFLQNCDIKIQNGTSLGSRLILFLLNGKTQLKIGLAISTTIIN